MVHVGRVRFARQQCDVTTTRDRRYSTGGFLAADKTHPVPTIGMTIAVIVCIVLLIMATPFMLSLTMGRTGSVGSSKPWQRPFDAEPERPNQRLNSYSARHTLSRS